METNPPPLPYLLLFRNSGPENYQHLTATERQHLIDRWNAWYDDLADRGVALEGQPLAAATRVVSSPGNLRVVDGPYPELKEAIGGYVRLLVHDLDEATEIARQHPALRYGLQIEIRALTDECHLGVTAHQAPLSAGLA